MASDIRRFINPKFLRTIDLALMQELFSKHFSAAELPHILSEDPERARHAIARYFQQPVTDWSEPLIVDLHRVAELGTADGLQLILTEARRQDVVLYPGRAADQEGGAHDPKHVALHTYLNHSEVFEAAADFRALRTPRATAELRGAKQSVEGHLGSEATDAFKMAFTELLAKDLQGQYCRLGIYEEEDEINLVVSYGGSITARSVVTDGQEEVTPIRAIKHAVLRYAPGKGILQIGGIPKAQQKYVAEIFAKYILRRPGFFSGASARDLYTLEPIAQAGPDFEFDTAFDERIIRVRIISAVAELYERGLDGASWRVVRGWESRDASGGALRHFRQSEVQFEGDWCLSEITFRVFFNQGGQRPVPVTVNLRPPGTLKFYRNRFEKAIHELIARNGLERDRDAGMAVAAAE